ncbi:hypothetical protein [Pedobacter punctiformis]|uniref:HEAT repeat domain-containing protein n=1 Tax=Pedobacter punctiformis TaxID=3004097 RepID=A0ABT4L3B8_9SPHI|nr:hypothetical protein [Pedobacter sp. HCMS5-2]MCZ4242413.1 hypothetical protein [Pedobacter sp. HCMS5-2]
MNIITSERFEELMIIVIIILLIAILIVSILYLLKISSIIDEGKKNDIYEGIVDAYLNDIETCTIKIEQVAINFIESPHFRDPLFRELMTKELINTHHYLTGLIKNRLQTFYFSSGLVNDSYLKLKSNDWHLQCKGINEFSEMDAISYYDDILSLRFNKNSQVRLQAVLSLIKLKGKNAYKDVSNFDYNVNRWAIANVIELIKDLPDNQIFDYNLMLNSNNDAVKIIGISLIEHFKLKTYEDELNTLKSDSVSSTMLKLQY